MNGQPLTTSSWLTGTVRHRRRQPRRHEFQYRTGMLALNLDDWHQFGDLSPLVSVERFNLMSLHRQDYLDPTITDLKQAVCERVERATGWRPDGPVELISHPRHLGYVFNPVSFYFCYHRGQSPALGAVPRVILAQITNTPWRDRHVYCLQVDDVIRTSAGWQTVKAEFSKRFHVSPFNPMDQRYQWSFSFRGPAMRIHMAVNQDADGDGTSQSRIFDATLLVRRTRLDRKEIRNTLLRFPVESFKVVAGIYWHAMRLKLKGVPFHSHPNKLPSGHPHRGLGSDDGDLDLSGCSKSGNEVSGKKPARISSWRT